MVGLMVIVVDNNKNILPFWYLELSTLSEDVEKLISVSQKVVQHPNSSTTQCGNLTHVLRDYRPYSNRLLHGTYWFTVLPRILLQKNIYLKTFDLVFYTTLVIADSIKIPRNPGISLDPGKFGNSRNYINKESAER